MEHSFVPYIFTILWKVGQFPHWANRTPLALRPPTYLYLQILTLHIIQMIIQKCYIGPFFTVLGYNVSFPPLFKRTLLPFRMSFIFDEFVNVTGILCGYFDCFFIFNQVISYLLLTFLIVIIENSFTTTTLGPSFLPLGCISKSFLMFFYHLWISRFYYYDVFILQKH